MREITKEERERWIRCGYPKEDLTDFKTWSEKKWELFDVLQGFLSVLDESDFGREMAKFALENRLDQTELGLEIVKQTENLTVNDFYLQEKINHARKAVKESNNYYNSQGEKVI